MTGVRICLFTFISRICSYTGISKSQVYFHVFQKRYQCPHIIPILKNFSTHNVSAVHCDLHVISRLQLGIPHMIILHVYKSGIRICFAVVIPALETGCMTVIDRLAFQKPAEQFQISLVPTYAFSSWKSAVSVNFMTVISSL